MAKTTSLNCVGPMPLWALRALYSLWMTLMLLVGGTWVHLNLFNIPSSTTEIPRITATSLVATFPSGTLGKSDWDVGHATTTWGGPCPPNTSTPSADTHSYHFKIYAMSSATITLPNPLAPLTWTEFETAYSRSILGSAEMIGEFTTTEQ